MLAARPVPVPEPEDARTAQDPADGYAQEDWRLGLEALVGQGRTAVREAVDAGGVDEAAAGRAQDLQERLERVLAEEEARTAAGLAAARAEDWLAAWRAAADPRDPLRAISQDADIGDGRRIADDPALAQDLRRAVAGVVEGHDAREAVVRAAEPWLRAWERFEGGFHDRAAALLAPDAAGRIERGRALLDHPGLPEPLQDRIAAIVDDHDAHGAERERERERQRQDAEAHSRAEEQARERVLDAARTHARHAAAHALEESGAVRRKLAQGPPAGTGIEAAVDGFGELADSRRRLGPDLSPSEAQRLDEAVGKAAGMLETRIGQAKRKLENVWDTFGKAWINYRCDKVCADWEAHMASDAFQPQATESHQQWIGQFRKMTDDPRLDPGRRDRLEELLRDYDTVWPQQRAHYLDVVGRWNAMAAQSRTRGISTSDVSGSEALFREMRGLAALAPLSKEERDTVRAVVEEQDEHEKMRRSQSSGMGM